MKYQIFEDEKLKHDNVDGSELFNHVPAGSKLISGNSTRMIKRPQGGLEEHHEIKATYRLIHGGKLSIVQIK